MSSGLSKKKVREILSKKELTVAVYGLGRVGLPLAAAWLRAGFKVIGADIQDERVKRINEGISPILDEPGVPDAVQFYVKNGRFKATTDLIKASETSDVKLVTVPTTRTERCFEEKALESALRAIGNGLKEGGAVSIECSVPPTTTERWAKPILEEESGLVAERDFALAFSPERIFEGRALEDIEERYPKIVGGIGPNSAELFSSLYKRVAKKGVIRMRSSTEAELAKLFEGIYRDVNIALANELAGVCEALGAEYQEVREASNSQPFCHLHRPSVGVGGACIPYYPYFVMEKAEENNVLMPLTKLARIVNEEMPRRTLEMARGAMAAIGKSLSGSKVAILGLAFRGDVADSRNSPTYVLVDFLKEQNARIVVQDPLIDHDELLSQKDVALVRAVEDACKGASLIIIATGHSVYSDVDLEEIAKLADIPAVILDGANVLKGDQIPIGIYFVGLGRKSINKL